MPVMALARMTVEAALVIGAVFPGGGVTDFRRAQQARTVASVAMFGNHLIRGFRPATAACSSGHFHPFAFLPLHTHLADRLEAFGNVVIRRSLSADSPEGQYGCWCSQHFHN